MNIRKITTALATAVLALATTTAALAAEINLLNVSYDPTRELYVEFNAAFAKYWKQKTGDNVTIKPETGAIGTHNSGHRGERRTD